MGAVSKTGVARPRVRQQRRTPQLPRPGRASTAAAGIRRPRPRQARGGEILRVRRGRGFVYLSADGSLVQDERELARIRSLAIPPAWTDVRIAASPRARIQADGRDAKGRKQYRYRSSWRRNRDRAKFGRMAAFGAALPRIREQVEEDLALPGVPREKVLAAVVRLMETTLIRIGNDQYARMNDSYGLTTLKDGHARISKSTVRLRFRGKSGMVHHVRFRDRTLARIVARCRDLPGEALFQYADDAGRTRRVRSADVNAYLRRITGDQFSAKDFRTWAGTMCCTRSLWAATVGSVQERKRAVKLALEEAAERLGNTPAVCRSAYVHPAVIRAFEEGSLRRPGGECTDEEALIALLQALPCAADLD